LRIEHDAETGTASLLTHALPLVVRPHKKRKLTMKSLFLLTTAFALLSSVAIAEEYDPKGEPKSVLTDAKGRLTDEQLFERAKDECSAGRQIDWPKLTAEGLAEVRECITKAKEQRILKDPQVAEICGIYSKGMALTECAYNVYKNKNIEK
jgi:hypothetical protein